MCAGVLSKLLGGSGKKAEGKHSPETANAASSGHSQKITGVHNPDARWDAQNRPVGYILGASPGFAQFAQGDEKLASTGLGRKIAKASRMGFEFAMIDYEALSEMYEPELEKLIEHIKSSQGNPALGTYFEVGVHLPTDMDLCIANAFQWKQMQEKLIRGAYSAADLVKARFYLFHTSSNIRPHVTFKVGQQEARVAQVSHDGLNLGEFMEMVDQLDGKRYKDPITGDHGKISKTPDEQDWKGLADWFKAKFISVLFNVMGAAGDPTVIGHLEQKMISGKIYGLKSGYDDVIEEHNNIRKKAWDGVKETERKQIGELIEGLQQEIINLKNNITTFEELLATEKISEQQAREIKTQIHNQQQQIRNIEKGIEHHKKVLKAIVDSPQIDNVLQNVDLRESIDPTILQRLQMEFYIQLNGGKIHPEIKPDPKFWDIYKKFENLRRTLEHYDFDQIFEFWKNHGSECEERVAYHVIAKYMWLTQDPFWIDIVGAKYEPDRILKQADEGREYYNDDKTAKPIEKLVENLITAVASKYIQGHLFTTNATADMRSLPEKRIINSVEGLQKSIAPEDKAKATSVYWYTRLKNLRIYIETAMPPQGQEGQLRIMSASDHIRLVKHIDNGEYTSYTMDFEHLMDNFIDPGTDIENLHLDGEEMPARFITMLHVNAPRPVMGAHAPIDLISNDQLLLYKWMLALRKKGMKNAYMIWEMGSYGSRESAVGFRRLIECLSGEIPINKLPHSFFGLDDTFEAQQHVAIREHAYDPLEGVLTIPEEDHTLLSSAAKDKGKLAEWLKERLR